MTEIASSTLPFPSDSCILGYHQVLSKANYHICYDLSSQLIALSYRHKIHITREHLHCVFLHAGRVPPAARRMLQIAWKCWRNILNWLAPCYVSLQIWGIIIGFGEFSRKYWGERLRKCHYYSLKIKIILKFEIIFFIFILNKVAGKKKRLF